MGLFRKRLLAGALALLTGAVWTGCARQTTAEIPPLDQKPPEEVIVLSPEAPAEGVGRVMPEVVVPRNRLICIDPGHGFYDPGTGPGYMTAGTYERDITVKVSGFLKEKLENMGFDVVLTHNGEEIPAGWDWDGNGIFSAIYERPTYINQVVNPDYMVSIHVNAVENQEKCGAIVFYHQSSYKINDWSEGISHSIADAIDSGIETTAVTRVSSPEDTADSSFAVCRETNCAASLVELGFCTNQTDAENLINPVWQEQIAAAIARGIGDFFDQLDA